MRFDSSSLVSAEAPRVRFRKIGRVPDRVDDRKERREIQQCRLDDVAEQAVKHRRPRTSPSWPDDHQTILSPHQPIPWYPTHAQARSPVAICRPAIRLVYEQVGRRVGEPDRAEIEIRQVFEPEDFGEGSAPSCGRSGRACASSPRTGSRDRRFAKVMMTGVRTVAS
jgi:hypothetical protein